MAGKGKYTEKVQLERKEKKNTQRSRINIWRKTPTGRKAGCHPDTCRGVVQYMLWFWVLKYCRRTGQAFKLAYNQTSGEEVRQTNRQTGSPSTRQTDRKGGGWRGQANWQDSDRQTDRKADREGRKSQSNTDRQTGMRWHHPPLAEACPINHHHYSSLVMSEGEVVGRCSMCGGGWARLYLFGVNLCQEVTVNAWYLTSVCSYTMTANRTNMCLCVLHCALKAIRSLKVWWNVGPDKSEMCNNLSTLKLLVLMCSEHQIRRANSGEVSHQPLISVVIWQSKMLYNLCVKSKVCDIQKAIWKHWHRCNYYILLCNS